MSDISKAVKSVIGGASASEYVAAVAGGPGQQVAQPGSNVIALRPMSSVGGRRRSSRRSRSSRKTGGSAAAHASVKKIEGGRRRSSRRSRRSRSSRK